MVLKNLKEIQISFKQFFLRLCLNALRLLVLLNSLGILFHKEGPMKDMAF